MGPRTKSGAGPGREDAQSAGFRTELGTAQEGLQGQRARGVRVYADCRVDWSEALSVKTKVERARIREAFFGRIPGTGGFRPGPVGLNVTVEFQSAGTAVITITAPSSMEGLLNDLKCNRADELVGKEVLTYSKGFSLVGISSR